MNEKKGLIVTLDRLISNFNVDTYEFKGNCLVPKLKL